MDRGKWKVCRGVKADIDNMALFVFLKILYDFYSELTHEKHWATNLKLTPVDFTMATFYSFLLIEANWKYTVQYCDFKT